MDKAVRVPAEEVPTPHLRVDLRRLDANVRRTQDAATSFGANLRPHFKTHRAGWIARRQMDAGAIGVTCATIEQLGAAAVVARQVLMSSPVQLDRAAASRIAGLSASGDIIFSAASGPSLEALRRALGPDRDATVLLDVDVGCDRGGLDPEECGGMASRARELGLAVVGVLSYPGQGYAPGRQAEAAQAERDMLERAALSLTRSGFEVEHLSAGSSPTFQHIQAGPATEFRPGTYVFGDCQQIELESMGLADVSLDVVATVIAQRDGQVILDAGAKILGRDSPPWLAGHGLLREHPEVRLTKIYDHHGVIAQEGGHPSFAIGDRVTVVPNNVNTAVALRRAVWVDDGSGSLLRAESDAEP